MATSEQVAEMIREMKEQREQNQHMLAQMMAMMQDKQEDQKTKMEASAAAAEAAIAKPVEGETGKGKLLAKNVMSVDKFTQDVIEPLTRTRPSGLVVAIQIPSLCNLRILLYTQNILYLPC